MSITLRYAGNGFPNITANKIYKLITAQVGDGVELEETSISDDGTTVTIGGNLNLVGSTNIGASVARYVQDFINETSLTILGVTHALATKNLIIQLYNEANPAHQIWADVRVHASTFDVTISFAAPQSGYVVIL